MSKWINTWLIDGSKGKTWKVSIDKDGNYGCSCPVWKFKRIQCHHIEAVRKGASKLRTAMVGKPEIVDSGNSVLICYDPDTNKLYIPQRLWLTPMEQVIKIAKLMLEHGFTMEEFRERYGLTDDWTATYLFRLIKMPERLSI